MSVPMSSNQGSLVFYSHIGSIKSSLAMKFLNIETIGNPYPFCIFDRLNSPMSLLNLGHRQLIAPKYF